MVNPGVFQGSRKEFLIGEKPNYKAGVEGGYAKDALAQILRRYFKRYPVELPLDVEPTEEALAAVDDEAADPEPVWPDESQLTPEAYETETKRLETRGDLLKQRKGQIRRWMQYQYMKDNEIDPTDPSAENPYRIILHQLTGISTLRPRLQTAAKLWRKVNRDEIEAEVQRRAEAAGIPKKRFAPIREKVVKELFNALPSEERETWLKLAKEEHIEALDKWDRQVNGTVSMEPENRQRCIQGLTQFIKPILDIVCEATGWKATFIAGGPEPAQGGRLNMISVHSGTTSGDVKMTFGRSEQSQFKAYVVPTFSKFLRKCYSPEECQARALPTDGEFDRVQDVELEHGEVHSVDFGEGQTLDASRSSTISSRSTHTEPRPPVAQSLGHRSASTTPRSVTPAPRQPSPAAHSPSPVAFTLDPVARSPPVSPLCSPAPSRQASPLAISTSEEQSTAQPDLRPTSPTPPILNEDTRPTQTIDTCSTVAPIPSPPRSQISKKRNATDAEVADQPVEGTRVSKRTRRSTTGEGNSASTSTPGTSAPRAKGTASKRMLKADSTSWFEDALALLKTGDFGQEWRDLLEQWSAFEAKEGYAQVATLSARKRPLVVGTWVKSGRPIPWNAAINDVEKYCKEFNDWWTSVQPDWRRNGTQLISKKVDGNWDQLRLPGLNGIFSALAGMFIWGRALESPKSNQSWLAAVKDCRLVLDKLCT